MRGLKLNKSQTFILILLILSIGFAGERSRFAQIESGKEQKMPARVVDEIMQGHLLQIGNTISIKQFGAIDLSAESETNHHSNNQTPIIQLEGDVLNSDQPDWVKSERRRQSRRTLRRNTHPFSSGKIFIPDGIAEGGIAPQEIDGSDENQNFSFLINGENSSVTEMGDYIELTVQFPPEVYSAEISVFGDNNGDGLLDAEDISLMGDFSILDNDVSDENLETGIWQMTYKKDGPNDFAGQYIFRVTCNGESQIVPLVINSLDTDYSISGTVEPALPFVGVLVFAEDSNEMFASVTDKDGHFQVFLPDEFPRSWTVAAVSLTDDLRNYLVPDYQSVYVNGHEIGFEFAFELTTSFIEGLVFDAETGLPASNIWLEAGNFLTGNYFDGITEFDGLFRVPVKWGQYRVCSFDEEYLQTCVNHVFVLQDNTEKIDLFIVPLGGDEDGQISGVIWDQHSGEIVPNVMVHFANGSTGLTIETNEFGEFLCDVPVGEYSVSAWAEDYYERVFGFVTVLSGDQVNLELTLINTENIGGIRGHISSLVGEDEVDNAFVQARDLNSNIAGSVWVDSLGYYEIPLEANDYFIQISSSDFHNQTFWVSVAGAWIDKDLSLLPIGAESGTISGYVNVYDESGHDDSRVAVEDALVFVWSYSTDKFQGVFTTDAEGFFTASLPIGSYKLLVDGSRVSPGFIPKYSGNVGLWKNACEVTVEPLSETEVDFELEIGHSVAGAVLAESEQNIAGAIISVYDVATGNFAGFSISDNSGYQIGGLKTSAYILKSEVFGYRSEYFGGSLHKSSAENLIVQSDLSGVDFRLNLDEKTLPYEIDGLENTISASGWIGNLGAKDFPSFKHDGEGFLFGASLWLGSRGEDGKAFVISPRQKFPSNRPSWEAVESPTIESNQSDLDIYARYSYSNGESGADVLQRVYHWQNENFAIVDFTITLDNWHHETVFAGFQADFDIDDYSSNSAGFIADQNLSYVQSEDGKYGGICFLNGNVAGHIQWTPDINPITSANKFDFLIEDGIVENTVSSGDFNLLQNAGEFFIKDAHTNIPLVYAIVIGNNLGEIINAADDALSYWEMLQQPDNAVAEIALENVYASPGDEIKIPITMQVLGNMISEVHLEFSDFYNVATITGIESDFDNFELAFENNEDSFEASIVDFSGETLPSGTYVLFTLRARISNFVEFGDIYELSIIDNFVSDFSGEPLAAFTTASNLLIGTIGDANFDGELDVLDIVTVVRLALDDGIIQPTEETWTADVVQDGVINILDVVAIVATVMEYNSLR